MVNDLSDMLTTTEEKLCMLRTYRAQCWTADAAFFFLLKTWYLPTKHKFSLDHFNHIICPFWLWRITITFTLLFGAPFAFGGKADFHKIKGREALSRLYRDLNTTDNNMGLTESLSISTELCNVHVGIKFFVFEISFFLTVLGQSCM
jgi:hypothetical protein